MILLTGATGFLGSSLLKRFLEARYDVCCVKRKSSNLHRVSEVINCCKWYDLEPGIIEQIFKENPIRIVIHCATNYGREDCEYFKVYQTNVFFPLELLEFGLKYGCKYFINTDTFSVKEIDCLWGGSRKPYKGAYTITKYMFTHIVREQIAKWDISFINLQLEHLYGPNDGENKFVNSILRQLQENVKELELTEGLQVRDWVYLEDVEDAYMSVLRQIERFGSRAFHQIEVGTGEGRSVREFVETAKRLTNSSTELLFGKRQMNQSELPCSIANIHMLQSLGWCFEHGIEEGIRKIINGKLK